MKRDHRQKRQAGLTLVELMISIAIGMFVVLAATGLLLAARASYVAQDESARLQDTGRYALEVVGRAVRQAAYENWDSGNAPLSIDDSVSPNVRGIDARSLKATSPGIDAPVVNAINGSDVLAVRFFGAGDGASGDGSIVNCAGFGVPAAMPGDAEEGRGWSIFYVAKDSTGETELYCKYRGASGSWNAQAIARGVESFQVLYGIDTDGDALPNALLRASAVDALDEALVLEGADASARAADFARKTHWTKVVQVKLALLVRGSQTVRDEEVAVEHHLFGKEYSDLHGEGDVGTLIREADLPPATRRQMRKLFAITLQLRNQAAGRAQ